MNNCKKTLGAMIESTKQHQNSTADKTQELYFSNKIKRMVQYLLIIKLGLGMENRGRNFEYKHWKLYQLIKGGNWEVFLWRQQQKVGYLAPFLFS